MSVASSDVPGPLVQALLQARRADGAWGAYPGRPASTEATAFAALALHRLATASPRDVPPAAVPDARRWLVAHQRADGGWPATEQVPVSSWPTAPAVLALSALGGASDAVARGVTWLVAREGVRMGWRERVALWLRREDHRKVNDLDASIPGWPWIESTFSWVEPTAVALLALRAAVRAGAARADGAVRDRLDDGARLLVDRAVPDGGWNYGNRRVLEEELEPYPDTTAWALLALDGVPAARAVNASGLRRLETMMGASGSPLARALSVLALTAHGRDASRLTAALSAQCGGAARPGEPEPTDARSRALALMALTAPAALALA